MLPAVTNRSETWTVTDTRMIQKLRTAQRSKERMLLGITGRYGKAIKWKSNQNQTIIDVCGVEKIKLVGQKLWLDGKTADIELDAKCFGKATTTVRYKREGWWDSVLRYSELYKTCWEKKPAQDDWRGIYLAAVGTSAMMMVFIYMPVVPRIIDLFT